MRQHIQTLQLCFLIVCCALIGVNTFQLFGKLRSDRPIAFAGLKFSGLGERLNNENSIGYASDLDLKEASALAEYQQAQYVLAPVILDINQPSAHRFAIINCSDDACALTKLNELNARPLLRNQFGVILAEIQGIK